MESLYNKSLLNWFYFKVYHNFILGKYYSPDSKGGWVLHYQPFIRPLVKRYTYSGWIFSDGRKSTWKHLQWHKFPLNLIKSLSTHE